MDVQSTVRWGVAQQAKALSTNKIGDRIMAGEGEYRFVVLLDIEAGSLEEAYQRLYERMGNKAHDWETSDEAFGVDGAQIHPEELQRARMAFFALRESPLYKLAEAGDETI